jgi:hypothetical protein
VPGLAIAHHDGCEVGERCQIPARAHGSLLRDQGQDPVLEQLAQAFEQDLPDTGVPPCERRQPDRGHGRRRLVVQRTARSTTVEANEICRQLGSERTRDGSLAGLSKPRGHTVDRVTGRQPPIQCGHGVVNPPEDFRITV